MKSFSSAFLILIFFCFALPLFSETKNENTKYSSALTEIPVGNNSLWIRVYVFNSLEEGKEIAEDVYGIKNFDLIAKEEEFSKLQRMIPGDVIQGYEYGMFKTESEFWVFKNKGDGYLYGIGRYLNRK